MVYYIRFQPACRLVLAIFVILQSLSCGRNDLSDPGTVRPSIGAAFVKVKKQLDAGQWKEAENAFTEMSALGPFNDMEEWERSHLMLKYYLHYNTTLDSARLFLGRMSAIASRSSLPPQAVADAIFEEGNFFLAQKKYSLAFRFYHRAQKHVAENLQPCEQSHYTHRLGMVRYLQGDYGEAVRLIGSSLKQNSKCSRSGAASESFAVRQGALNSMMLCYQKMGRLDSAVKYGQMAAEFIDSQPVSIASDTVFHQSARGVVLGNLGGVLAEQGHVARAEKLLRRSIAINGRPGWAMEDAQTARLKLAELLLARGNFHLASQVLEDAETEFPKMDIPVASNGPMQATALDLRSRILAAEGNMSEAYSLARKYHALKDSLESGQAKLVGADMDAVFESFDRELQMERMDRESARKTFYLSLAGLLTLFGLAFWVYNIRMLRRSNDNIFQLNIANNRLAEMVEEQERIHHEHQLLLKVVSHDLRNPLGGISTIVGLMLEEPARTKDDIDTLKVLKSSGDAAFSLIDRLMEANPLIDPQRSIVDLGQLVGDSVAMFQFKASVKSQRINAELCSAMVFANRNELMRVMGNLLSNAVKFSYDGATIEVAMRIKDAKIEVRVRDYGIGISEGLDNKIFDMYSGPGQKGTAGEKSFGMGLAISRRILRSYGGTIGFTGLGDKGTIFRFALPLS